MWHTGELRSRAVVEREIEAARRARVRSVTALDFDAYQHLTEHIDDLLEELGPLLPTPRGASD